jgi:hypothetical protein
VAFSPDGRHFASAGGSTVRVCPWQPDHLVAEACARVTRNLSQEEWTQYLGDEPYRQTCPDLPSG